MKKSISIGLLVFTIVLLGIWPPKLQAQNQENQAQTPFDLSVIPPTAYLKIKPGNTAVHTITLKNKGTSKLAVTPSMVSFSADGKTGKPVLGQSADFPYLDTDHTSFETLELPPGSTAQLTLHFSVPATAEDKEYPLTVLFQADKSSDTNVNPSFTAVSGTIASNIIVLISQTNTLENRFSVQDFGQMQFVDSFSSLNFSPTIKNNSFAAAAASGSASLRNWRGSQVASYQINPSVILGYSTKKIEPVIGSGQTAAYNTAGFRVFRYKKPFLLGPYTFSLFLPSGDPERVTYTEQKIIVWAFPFTLLGAIVIACFALGGYYFYKNRTKSIL